MEVDNDALRDLSCSNENSDESAHKMTAEEEVEGGNDLLFDQNSDSDSDSSSNSDEEEAKLEKEAQELEEKVGVNPYDYSGHVALITTLQKLADLSRLRAARERMCKYFPLAPGLWLSWLRDETAVATSEEEKKSALNLFEKSVQDYMSVDIWLEYIRYSRSCVGSACNEDYVRDVCEKAVAIAGHDFRRGTEVWKEYILFEKQLAAVKEVDQSEQEAKLWRRLLSVPLAGTDKSYREFFEWANSHNVPIDFDVSEVESEMHRLEKFEKQLESCELGKKPQLYRDYCHREELKSRARATCIWERAVAESCLDPELWFDYLEFAYQKGGGTASEVLTLCERAVRNCPWSAQLWQFYLRALERFEKPNSDVTGLMERALIACSDAADSLRSIWIGFASYMLRRVKWSTKSNSDSDKGEPEGLEELRATFNKACEHLAQCFGLQGDPACEILQYWARVEGGRVGDMARARQLWNDILSQGHSSSAAMWLEYINLERLHGERKRLRSMFARALSSVQDWPESIYQAWINYERDEGTLDTLEDCDAKYKKCMEEVRKQREKESFKQEKKRTPDAKVKGKRKADHTENEGKWANVPAAGSVVSSEEAKSATKSDESQPPAKKIRKESESEEHSHGVTIPHDPSKDDRTVFVSNLAFTETEDAVRKLFEGVGRITDFRLVRDYKGRSKGYCYVEFSTTAEASEALKKDRTPLNNRPVFVSKCDPDKHTRKPVFKYNTGLEKNKLFVKGLAFSTTKEDLEEIYKQYGALKEVRLVTYRNGHSKGLAYVEFEDQASAARALQATDTMTVAGHTISVAFSRPPEKRDKGAAPTAAELVAPIASEAVKPRGLSMRKMAMFPRSVQLSKGTTAAASSSRSSSASSSSSSSAPVTNGETQKPMTNADFRQFLLSGKKS
ncbi:squamous cell carcinoma antigen recognized by T-cells 3 [Schistocerca cancellata]|uniref:squamous cell carcinoma antigen recognized by T-cells 3 n=1 Tax=Schistocerca cancellata TaxID=274614 RepID=UPI002117CB3A|nr:squamous cell carcinoma antigen recognized by T-cells 3 [Schistocerca cancellata]